MLSATGNPKYLEGFGPPVDGFDHVPFDNMNAVRDAIGPETAGIIVEPIQGEGGVRPAPLQFLRDLRTACDEFGILLGMDEVQTGMGRTGRLFAHEWAGHRAGRHVGRQGHRRRLPDGRGARARARRPSISRPGTHGTTFGGNPLACAAANAVLDVMLAPGFLDAVDRKGRRLGTG